MNDDTNTSNQSLDCTLEDKREYALQTEMENSMQRASTEHSRSEAVEKLNEIQHDLNHNVAVVGTENNFNELQQPTQLHQEDAINALMLGGILCAQSVQDMSQQYQHAREERVEQAIAMPNGTIIDNHNEVLQDALQNDLYQQADINQQTELSIAQGEENELIENIVTNENSITHENNITNKNIIMSESEVTMNQEVGIDLNLD